jgi:hypothetical protein
VCGCVHGYVFWMRHLLVLQGRGFVLTGAPKDDAELGLYKWTLAVLHLAMNQATGFSPAALANGRRTVSDTGDDAKQPDQPLHDMFHRAGQINSAAFFARINNPNDLRNRCRIFLGFYGMFFSCHDFFASLPVVADVCIYASICMCA